MASCEKCWRDAHRGDQCSVPDEYARLLKERADNPCTPEEQAGPDAGICWICNRSTIHQHTRTCIVCGLDTRIEANE